MKKFFALAISLALLLGFSRTATAQSTSWYRRFSATIDKYPVTIHLHRAGDDYSGFYYYEKTQRPFYLVGNSGDSSAGPGKIRLAAYIPGNEAGSETLTLAITGNNLSGDWKKDGEEKSLVIAGTESRMDSLGFDMVYVQGGDKLRPAMENSPVSSYSAASVWPRENTPTATYLKRLINDLFGHKNSGEEIGKFLLQQKKKFLEGYRKDNKEVADSDLVAFPGAYSLDEDQHLLILYQSTRLLTLSNWNYAFSGGAHGNYSTAYIPIDLTTRKQLRLADVLTPAGRKQLNGLVEKYFRKDFGLSASQPLTDAGLFENKIAPTDNFFLTGKGIGLGYTPYEIGPYAMGEIVVYIPFTELNTSLNSSFKKLIE